ncbi:protein of unknown function [Xenorhabdus doucetiae]|uniref:Uncharacterized protein n=1 Tax=Xenorhabdus doucetiae TaxID=351671 RepID=A0A068QN80_9GAMM|nr:protein of unknown function [Xenorhabdus doucetiae]
MGGQIKSDVSEKYTDFYSHGSDASLVNDALSIQTVTRHHEDDSLGYHQNFFLPKACLKNFLRNMTNTYPMYCLLRDTDYELLMLMA